MGTARKITVEVPPALLEKARRASGTGITQTIRIGLQLVAASRTYARLRLVVVRTDDGVLGKIHRRTAKRAARVSSKRGRLRCTAR